MLRIENLKTIIFIRVDMPFDKFPLYWVSLNFSHFNPDSSISLGEFVRIGQKVH